MRATRRQQRALSIGSVGSTIYARRICQNSPDSWDQCGLIGKLGTRMYNFALGASATGVATAVRKMWKTPGVLVMHLNQYNVAGSMQHTVNVLLSEPKETYRYMLEWIVNHHPEYIPNDYPD